MIFFYIYIYIVSFDLCNPKSIIIINMIENTWYIVGLKYNEN